MATHLSFAGTAADIGGRILARKIICTVTMLLQGNHDLPYCIASPQHLVFIGWMSVAFRKGRSELSGCW